MEEVENWLPVVGWEDLYEVSDLGRISSLDRIDARGRLRPGRIRRHFFSNGGYARITLYREGLAKSLSVHRLVLEAFVGPCPSNQEALHGPGGVTDNRLSNLRWGTHSDNVTESVLGGTHPMTKRTSCPRGHELAAPNLVPSALKKGLRSCLSCQRATSKLRSAGRMTPEDLKSESDRYYAGLLIPRGRA